MDPPLAGSLSRRRVLATMAGAGIVGSAGCMERLAARAERDLPIRTVAVESDRDGRYYHPRPEHIEGGTYSPLTRPLFVYVNHDSLAARTDLIAAFLEFLFEQQRGLAREVGYYATDQATVEENEARLASVLSDLDRSVGSAEVEGEIACSGSNTVAPITRAAGEDFEREHPDVLVAVEPEGTGAGFAEFVRGNADIQSASREILPAEARVADRHGIEYSRYEIGWDGVAIVVHADNDWLDRITLDELRDVWDFESELTRWNQLRSEFPDDRISLWGRDSASGTFDFFTETIAGEVGRIRTDYSPHTDTGSIMAGVAHSSFSLGWGGVGYYTELKEEPFAHA